uniref:site-specific DNA-methyltransferase (adenine-specific) n=1 Tax=Rhodopseudomonas palustris (strain DX-1) TaxID=652103 RepID=E6VP54_RHOPX
MARKPVTDISAWPSLSLEGNLIAPATIASIDRRQASEQSEEDYRIRKGLTIREEISTAFRVGQSHFDAFAKLETPSVEATRRFIRAFLQETFGFDDLAPADGALSFIGGGRVPIVIVPPADEKLDRRSATLSTDRTRSPAFALQDHLNEHDETLWGLVTNGTLIRLMRDNASLTRPAYIEADLAQIFTNEDASSFAVLWLLIHRTRFGVADAPATDCALERWRDAGSKEGEVARDRLAVQVQIALKVLGSGFLEANPDLAARLKSGEINLTEWFNELLRLVYRLIFLMVAEDRNLLHPEKAKPDARKLYAEGYSLAALRAQCYRAASWDKHHDRYEGVKIVFHALAHGQEVLALPALGGLFSTDKLPHLETARLRNRAFMEALYRLSWLSDKAGIVPVNWRAMETEELGSVYESLLELQPQLGEDGKTLHFASEAAEQKGNQRKITGSYYTPDSLVQALLDTALDPVLDKTEAEADDPEQALLELSVIDPACGSGHFLLAAARRIATRLARIRAEGTPSLADFRHALRDVARSCLHGVDRNPMAVELTKVALWIETVDPGLPLGFFDAQIRCGDALLGVFDLKVLEDGIPDAAYKPLTGGDKEVARHYANKNKREKAERDRIAEGFGFNRARDLMRDFEALRSMPEDTVEQVEAKSAKLRALTSQGAGAWQLEMACDLYVSAFLLPKTKGGPHAGPDGMPRRGAETVPTSGTVWEWLRGVQPFGPLFAGAIDATRSARAFHWPLEFPDVMQRGGFDVVLGNPPWERIKLQEQEFFAARSPDIANAPNKAARDRLIKALEKAAPGSADRGLFDEFTEAKREAEATSEFVRVPGEDGGRFALTGRGDVNTYALFAELFASLATGRAGVILPTGIATDSTTSTFFTEIIRSRRLVSLFSFYEIRLIFPATDDRNSFCLLTMGKTDQLPRFAFSILKTSDTEDDRRVFELSAEQILEINPNTRTAPIFRSRADAEMTAKIYANAPILINDSQVRNGNPWHITFMTMFHMSNDSGLFESYDQLADNGVAFDGNCLRVEEKEFLPLYEAKMIHQFDHRWAGYEAGLEGSTDDPSGDKSDPDWEPSPRYWIDRTYVEARLGKKGWKRNWLMGWRDITNATAANSVIATAFPRKASNHKLPLFFCDGREELQHVLLANLNSLVLDYAAKQKIAGTNLTYFYLKQFPILPPVFYTEPRLAFITPKVLELTYTSHSLTSFARDLGHDGPPFPWDEDRRALLRAELDAFYARAYGLTRDDLRYILDPSDMKGPDYPSETFRVLKEKEIRQHGEYRTQRLVLAAWDRMEADGTFVDLGLADAVVAQIPLSIQLPPLERIPAGVWAWPQGVNERDRVRAQLRAMVGILPEASDVRRVRLATLACLQPSLLDEFLSDGDRQEWRRIVAHPSGVTQLVPPTNAAWGAAFNELVSSAVLEVSSAGDAWGAGERLDRSTLNVDDPAVGRALFAWSRLQAVDLDQGLTRVSADILPFIREGRLAA